MLSGHLLPQELIGYFGRQLGLQIGVQELLRPGWSGFVGSFLCGDGALVTIVASLQALLALGAGCGLGAAARRATIHCKAVQ